ncbi:GTP cyclohydrolase 1 type 2/Nif3 [Panaeolus papilionaceus]|nr:GTP cyclohydrolase 1 type 2/Nif3 [Panaeolus papilionaceus]
MSLTRFKLIFFAPRDSTKRILDHLFQSFPQEVGKIGDYERCAFVTRGTGQFQPVNGANPTIGQTGQLEYVEEDKVEVVVNDKGQQEEIKNAIQELKNAHPYEEPAYEVYQMENL